MLPRIADALRFARPWSTALLLTCSLSAAYLTATGEPRRVCTSFALEDQHERLHRFAIPREAACILTVADRKGADRLEPWVRAIKERYGKRVEIIGVADLTSVPKPIRTIVRSQFKAKIKRDVLLDWEGVVVRQFSARKSVPNIYLVQTNGEVAVSLAGDPSEAGLGDLFSALDRALKPADSREAANR